MTDSALFSISYGALWILVILLTLVVLELMRRGTRGGSENEDQYIGKTNFLAPGTSAPTFEAPEVSSRRMVSSTALKGKSTMLVFTAAGCSVCEATAGELATFGHSAKAQLVVLCSGAAAACADFAETHLPDALVLSDDQAVIAGQFRISRTPTVVQVDREWQVVRYGFPRLVTQFGLASWFGAEADQTTDTESFSLINVNKN